MVARAVAVAHPCRGRSHASRDTTDSFARFDSHWRPRFSIHFAPPAPPFFFLVRATLPLRGLREARFPRPGRVKVLRAFLFRLPRPLFPFFRAFHPVCTGGCLRALSLVSCCVSALVNQIVRGASPFSWDYIRRGTAGRFRFRMVAVYYL